MTKITIIVIVSRLYFKSPGDHIFTRTKLNNNKAVPQCASYSFNFFLLKRGYRYVGGKRNINYNNGHNNDNGNYNDDGN